MLPPQHITRPVPRPPSAHLIAVHVAAAPQRGYLGVLRKHLRKHGAVELPVSILVVRQRNDVSKGQLIARDWVRPVLAYVGQ